MKPAISQRSETLISNRVLNFMGKDPFAADSGRFDNHIRWKKFMEGWILRLLGVSPVVWKRSQV